MQLLVDEVPLEERQALGGRVIELHPLDHLGADLADVASDLLEEHRIVDEHAPVVAVELFSEHPHGKIELSVEEPRTA